MNLEKLENFYKILKSLATVEAEENNRENQRRSLTRISDRIKKEEDISGIDHKDLKIILNEKLSLLKTPSNQVALLENIKKEDFFKNIAQEYIKTIKEINKTENKHDILLSINAEDKNGMVKMFVSNIQKIIAADVVHEREFTTKDLAYSKEKISICLTLTSEDLLRIKDKIEEFKHHANIDAVHILPDFQKRSLEDKVNSVSQVIKKYDFSQMIIAAELGLCSTSTVYFPVDGMEFLEKSLKRFYNATKKIYAGEELVNFVDIAVNYEYAPKQAVNAFKELDLLEEERKNKSNLEKNSKLRI